jgi:hypothetical protein
MTGLTHVETAAMALSGDRAPAVANPAYSFAAGPPRMGSLVPSSPAPRGRIVRHSRRAEDEAVVEPGAGTGVVFRALLASGLPPDLS